MCWRTEYRVRAQDERTCDLCSEPIKAGNAYRRRVHLPDASCEGSDEDPRTGEMVHYNCGHVGETVVIRFHLLGECSPLYNWLDDGEETIEEDRSEWTAADYAHERDDYNHDYRRD